MISDVLPAQCSKAHCQNPLCQAISIVLLKSLSINMHSWITPNVFAQSYAGRTGKSKEASSCTTLYRLANVIFFKISVLGMSLKICWFSETYE